MKELWEPGDRVVVHLPLRAGAAFFAIGVSLVPVFGFLIFTRDLFDPDRPVWVPFFVAAFGFGMWSGWALARRFLGNTLVLDWHSRTAVVLGPGKRSFPFEDITTVTLEVGERHVRRAGRVFTATLVVRTKTERFPVRHRGGDPSQKNELLKELTPEAKKLARALRRELE